MLDDGLRQVGFVRNIALSGNEKVDQERKFCQFLSLGRMAMVEKVVGCCSWFVKFADYELNWIGEPM